MAIKPVPETATSKVDDAGGVLGNERKAWFVAIVNNRSEKKHSEILRDLGYDVFVPIQREKRIWRNGTAKTVDRVLIAAMVFIRCTEGERIAILKKQLVKRFMVDQTKRAGNGKHPLAVIPDYQIESFRKFIENTEESVEISPIPYQLGESVKVISGKFMGLIGNVVQYEEGNAKLVICLGFLGCAKLNIDTRLVKRV